MRARHAGRQLRLAVYALQQSDLGGAWRGRFTFSTPRKLPAGRYLAHSRAADREGNAERKGTAPASRSGFALTFSPGRARAGNIS